jgi:hypothetical protein
VDFQKDHDEYREDQQRMQILAVFMPTKPSDQFRHPDRRFERRRGRKDNAEAFAVRIERFEVIGQGLVVTAMAFVLVGMDQQVAMELFDVILGQGNVGPMREDRFHHVSIAGDFLLIAGDERTDMEIGQEFLDIEVAEFCTFDTGGGTDAFDRGNAPQSGEAIRRNADERSPGTLEFVQLRDQREDRGGDPEASR